MRLTIKINMENAAFDDPNEVARILRELANLLAGSALHPGDSFMLRDINGNHIGDAKVTRA